MSVSETPGFAACPGCQASPRDAAGPSVSGEVIELSLPSIHCAGCISKVEKGLLARPEIDDARVNLSRKRVSIVLNTHLEPEILVDVLGDLGFEAQLLNQGLLGGTRDKAGQALLMRMAVAGFALMNVMLLSVAVWSGASDATRDLFHWISAAIALPVIGFSAQPFFSNAWSALRVKRLNMDVPISLAIILAVGMSLFETALSGHHAYFDAALSLIFFLLAGRYLDYRSRAAAKSAAAELSALEVPRVTRLDGNGVRNTVDLADILVGDTVVVLPGGTVPVDGIVASGTSDIDRSLLTGESLPVHVQTGSEIHAGESNLSGMLTVNVTATREDSQLHRIVTMIDAAESVRNRYTALADKAAALYAPLVHILAFVAFLAWLAFSGDLRLSTNVAIAVLIITCPCALGLAVPAVSTAAASYLFRKGLLVKDGTALERLAEVDTVVFDKTGTLTDGVLRLKSVSHLPRQTLALTRALSAASTHPVARAIYRGLEEMGLPEVSPSEITETPGAGISAQWNGQDIRLGSASWTGAEGRDLQGSYIRIGTGEPVAVPLSTELRSGAKALISRLKERGLALHMLSGDSETACRDVAQELGIENWSATTSPEAKIDMVRDMGDAGHKVLMVGDGLNDTGALAAAYASLSPASAADASRTASDVVLLHGDLDVIDDLLSTSIAARKRVTENFTISTVYNLIAIPYALAGFATPLAAAIAMSASSITVILNALRIRGSR